MRRQRFRMLVAGFVCGRYLASGAHAEDIEIFVGGRDAGADIRPNVLLILDDSGSMQAETRAQSRYDPATIYPGGSCNAALDRVYWSDRGSPPSCDTQNYYRLSEFFCQRALNAFATAQGGTYFDYFAHYDSELQNRWEGLSSAQHSLPVECHDDLPEPAAGWPGHGGRGSAVYPRNGDPGQLWTEDATSPMRVSWGDWPTSERYHVFSGNYLNWYYGPESTVSRLQIMQDVASALVNSVNGINFGLMHFAGDEGGLVAHAMENVASGRARLLSAIDSLTADNLSPLEETLYEAYLYMAGKPARFGSGGVDAAFLDSDRKLYDSPIDHSCQKSHIVLLTDGAPSFDDSASSAVVDLIDSAGRPFSDLVGNVCDIEVYPDGSNAGDGGECLDELAQFMYVGDMSPLEGVQNITTHAVGFHVDLPVLAQTAARGGGEYHTATDVASLTAALTSIVATVLDTQSTFTRPAVSIDAFNRTRHRNDIYVGVFSPTTRTHWPGNLKKFRIRADGAIVDANGIPIIADSGGGLAASVSDLWSSTLDGSGVGQGGAASKLTAARQVYTFLGNPELSHASNAIDRANGALTDAMLGTGIPGGPTRIEVIDFIDGKDVADIDQDRNRAEARRQLGDPLHSAPVVVAYGPDDQDTMVFVGTNDGFLHAFNAGDGTEAWAFLPPEFIGRQAALLLDGPATSKLYGPDGSIRVQALGAEDGIIDAAGGDRAWLFFGMRRGGDAYYALDITIPDRPRVLWRKDSLDLPGLGQSWSSAMPARIDIGAATQNDYKLVLVLGGGYDVSQDAAESSTDKVGNSIYLLDMLSGDLLWHGSDGGGDQSFATAAWRMNYSFPADVRVLDLDRDGFSDRMYAADMGGQVWRFDIANGKPAGSLIAGGVIAQLGAAGFVSPTAAAARRFYYAPDVARVTTGRYDYLHLGIGSGHRAHPSSVATHDAFFALRDYATLAARDQSEHDAFVPITPGDLVDVTTDRAAAVPPGSPGWRLDLNDGGWQGEKVLAEARTFAGRVYFSTFRPGGNDVGCEPAPGTYRQYVVDLINAAPVVNLDGSVDDVNGDERVDADDLELTDRYQESVGFPQPETIFLFPEGQPTGAGESERPACAETGGCLVAIACQGLHCQASSEVRLPVRTFWTEDFEE